MEILFWFSFALIFYTYVGYPLLLFFVSVFFQKKVRKGFSEPRVSVILSAFNEEKTIERKLKNLLQLDYPPERLEILVGSDGASDKTDEIVSEFHLPRIRFFRFVRNLGKPHVLSALVGEASGSLVIFTDARQELDRQAIRALVSNFEDPEVGCVSGELSFKPAREGKRGSVAEGMGAYWRYEKFLRRKESEIGSMLGATGALYAIRRNLFPDEFPFDILVDDMYIPLSIIGKGYRAVFEARARAYDQPSERGREEFKRKVRTLAGNYQIFTHFLRLFLPFKSPVAWQIFSHKFLRLVVPFFLAAGFVSNVFLLAHPFYAIVLILQILFYGMAVAEAGQARKRGPKRGMGYLPYIFCLLNYSAWVGFVQFLTRQQKAAWEKAYA